VRLLGNAELAGSYAEAWDEWHRSDEAVAWEPATGDGLMSR
jgi:hypothetical protein